jgi:glycosyltransferase involved in cell wall biosynthesis
VRPTVSIIIPLYNYEEYIVDCVYTCLNAKYDGRKEVIVVDDCSTDSGPSEVRRLFGDKVTLLRTPKNSGYSVAKNLGIRKSTGQYIATLDADDMMTEDSLEVRASILDCDPETDMVHGVAYTIKAEGGYDYYLRRVFKLGITSRDKVNAQTVMMQRRVYLKFGLYDENLRSRGDNEMWNRLRVYDVPIVKVRKIFDPPVAFYRKHDRSMVEYRKKNQEYNNMVTERLRAAIEMRKTQGINANNTPWLDE